MNFRCETPFGQWRWICTGYCTVLGVSYLGPRKMGSGPGFSIYFFDPHGARLEVSCDTTKDEPTIVKDATSTKAKRLKELRTLCDDGAWLQKVTAHLPD